MQEKINNVTAGSVESTFRYCTAGGTPGMEGSRLAAAAVTNKTSCMHYDEAEVHSNIYTG